MSIRQRLRVGLIWSLALLLLSGCGSNNEDLAFTEISGQVGVVNPNPDPIPDPDPDPDPAPQLGSLIVQADPAALALRALPIRTRFISAITQIRVTLINSDDQELGKQTVPRGQQVGFQDIPRGNVLLRMEGLDTNGNVLGFFDKVVFVNGEVGQGVNFEGLRLDSNPPAIQFIADGEGTPFLVFTNSPDPTITNAFSVTIQAFTAQGDQFNVPVDDIALSSNGVGFLEAPQAQTSNGVGTLVISGLEFPPGSDSNTILTAQTPGFTSASTNSIRVIIQANLFSILQRVSVDGVGNEVNDDSENACSSADGRFVAFQSSATNLVTNDNNSRRDIFVRDLSLDTTRRVSINNNGIEGDDDSSDPSISDDGRYVSFTSDAENLVPNDTNNTEDIFRYDLQNNTITRVSVSDSEAQSFGNSRRSSISGSGRFVTFESIANNLVIGDNNNGQDVFVRDVLNGTTQRVSVDQNGNEIQFAIAGKPDISADGSVVCFEADFRGTFVPEDTNSFTDVYVRDLNSGVIQLASGAGNEDSDAARISDNGNFVIFESRASDIILDDNNGQVDIFLFDRTTALIQRVSLDGNGQEISRASFDPSVSGDGSFVSFTTDADELDPNVDNLVRSAVFIKNLMTGGVARITVNLDGEEPDFSIDGGFADSPPKISGDGRSVLFSTRATNLNFFGDDTNAETDVYIGTNPFLVTPEV